ncbi:hypothetical protein [Klebsiella pneumoniae]|uniref:hypothetical protein n=1 Tax=Klebsiella pneumoniae TaxID=573 RepID=UPI0021AD65B2|nr:hypothetical protein [Klebsiella pneumoniae]
MIIDANVIFLIPELLLIVLNYGINSILSLLYFTNLAVDGRTFATKSFTAKISFIKEAFIYSEKWRCDIITRSFIGILCLYLAITKQIALDGQ